MQALANAQAEMQTALAAQTAGEREAKHLEEEHAQAAAADVAQLEGLQKEQAKAELQNAKLEVQLKLAQDEVAERATKAKKWNETLTEGATLKCMHCSQE